MNDFKALLLAILIGIILCISNALIPYVFIRYIRNPILITTLISILIPYTIFKIYEVRSSLKIIISVGIIGFLVLFIGTAREFVFVLINFKNYPYNETLLERLLDAYAFVTNVRMSEIISAIFLFIITMSILSYLEIHNKKFFDNSFYKVSTILVLIFTSGLALGYTAHFYQFLSAFMTVIPLFVSIKIIKQSFQSNAQSLSLFYVIIAPFVSLYFGLLFSDYLIRFSWEYRYVLNLLFKSQESNSFILGLVASMLIGFTIITIGNRRNSEI